MLMQDIFDEVALRVVQQEGSPVEDPVLQMLEEIRQVDTYCRRQDLKENLKNVAKVFGLVTPEFLREHNSPSV